MHYNNLANLSDSLRLLEDKNDSSPELATLSEDVENDNNGTEGEVDKKLLTIKQDSSSSILASEQQNLHADGDQSPNLTSKDKASKWGHVLLSFLILAFFIYDAMWADPYLAWRYYQVNRN